MKKELKVTVYTGGSPDIPDLRYLDGPWRNDACLGYAFMAMRDAGVDEGIIRKVMKQMALCFNDFTVSEAAEYFIKNGH